LVISSDFRQDIVFNIRVSDPKNAEKELIRLENRMKKLNTHSLENTRITNNFDKTTGKMSSTISGKAVPAQQKINDEMKRFRMEALGLMFGGMAIANMFSQMTRAGFDLYKIGDILNTTYGVMMLPVMDILGDAIFGMVEYLMDLSDEEKMVVGTTMLLGQALGTALGGLGQAILFISSLKQIGGLAGLFTELKGVFTSLGKFAGKSLKTIIDVSTNFSDTFLNFFSPAGKWLKSKVTTLSNILTNKIDALITWLFGADFASGKGGKFIKTIVNVAIVFAILDLATRFLSEVFKGMGETFGRETTMGKVFIDLAVGTKDGFLGLIWKAYFEDLPILLDLLFNVVFDTSGIPSWLKNVFMGIFSFANPVVGISRYNQSILNQSSGLFDFLKGIMPFANGGIVNRPTLSLIGEAGPEAVVPLNNNNNTQLGNEIYAPEIYVNANISSDYDVNILAEKINSSLYNDYKRRRMTWA
jgi:hypothetical protein